MNETSQLITPPSEPASEEQTDQLKNNRSGFVALVGRPNVGKSSLLNKLIGQKIAIVSPKVQTTRTKILGVYNFPDKNGQIVFIDLPGLHKPVDKLGEGCLKISFDGAKEADLVIFMSEAGVPPGKGDKWIVEWLAQNCSKIPHLIVLNKLDLVRYNDKLERDIKAYKKLFSDFAMEPNLLTTSVSTDEGMKELTNAILEHLPQGPNYFPDEMLTNRSVRFLTAELIREQVLLLTQDEVPHSTAVAIETFEETTISKNKGEKAKAPLNDSKQAEAKKDKKDKTVQLVNGKEIQSDQKPFTKIKAFILTETESQKGIIIGKKGNLIREIGTKARAQIEEMLGHQVFLELKVKVVRKWRENQKELNKLGYSGEDKL